MNNVRKYRVKQLMTQNDLAKKSGVCNVTISFLENNLSSPMPLTIEKLSRALKVLPEELFPSCKHYEQKGGRK